MRVQAPTWQLWVDGGAAPSADKVAPLCLSVPWCVLSGDCSALVFASQRASQGAHPHGEPSPGGVLGRWEAPPPMGMSDHTPRPPCLSEDSVPRTHKEVVGPWGKRPKGEVPRSKAPS